MFKRKPEWIKVRPPGSPGYNYLKTEVSKYALSTVCQEANCPNIAECWKNRTLTLMILGDTCTRFCKFCNVKTGPGDGTVDAMEPRHTAELLKPLDLNYVVITSVDRDDLKDGGASHFAQTIREIKDLCPQTKVEVLTGDFQGDTHSLKTVLDAGPAVFAHNLETVKRLTPSVRDPRASYDTSLLVLKNVKSFSENIFSKSSLMLGLGETTEDILATMEDLRAADVDFLTMGQYLQPSRKHLPVERYVPPEEFDSLKEKALEMGFLGVASGPLVRSSYQADQLYWNAKKLE
jgi:lipoic acid synthetase